jgi:hypothetical protein
MLKLLSNLNIVQRMEATISTVQDTAIAAATLKQGSFLLPCGGIPGSDHNGIGFPIWTESNRDDTYGWTPDYTTTSQLTLIVGPHRAMTSEYTGTIVAGTLLTVQDDTGLLMEGTTGTDEIFAICEAVETDYVYLGTTYSGVITYVTI